MNIEALNDLSMMIRIARIDPSTATLLMSEKAWDALCDSIEEKMPGFIADSRRLTSGWKRFKYDGVTFAAVREAP